MEALGKWAVRAWADSHVEKGRASLWEKAQSRAWQAAWVSSPSKVGKKGNPGGPLQREMSSSGKTVVLLGYGAGTEPADGQPF